MDDVMICLVGEQPIPNLLPIRYDNPSHVVLAYTESTKEVCKRLKTVLSGGPQVHSLQVEPFNILGIRNTLEQFVTDRGWNSNQLVFNLTGGTKAMAFAAHGLAEKLGCRFLYLESDEVENRVYRYRFNQSGTAFLERDELIPEVISLDDYLKVHMGWYKVTGFSPEEGGKFEQLIYQVLQPIVNEIIAGIRYGSIEIDLVLRYGNQVGIAETKTGKEARRMEGIKQLNNAGRREFLGIYTKKLLIVATAWDHSLSDLRELTQASDIRVIELPSYDEQSGDLSKDDQERLVREVREALGG